MRRLLAVAAAVSVSPLLAADNPSFVRGQKVTLTAAAGNIPAFRHAADYGKYRELARNPSDRSYQLIRDLYPQSMTLIQSGTEVVVVDLDTMNVPGKIPSFQSLVAPGLIPALVVKVGDAEAPTWVPAIYARPTNSNPFPVEARLPAIFYRIAVPPVPEVGHKYLLYDSGDDGDVIIAAGYFEFERLMEASKAKDAEGLKKQLGKQEVGIIKENTSVLVLKVYDNPLYATGISAAEVRLLDGPRKNDVVFVPRKSLATLSLELVSAQAARQRRPTPEEIKRGERLRKSFVK